jgi:hypothetical protein
MGEAGKDCKHASIVRSCPVLYAKVKPNRRASMQLLSSNVHFWYPPSGFQRKYKHASIVPHCPFCVPPGTEGHGQGLPASLSEPGKSRAGPRSLSDETPPLVGRRRNRRSFITPPGALAPWSPAIRTHSKTGFAALSRAYSRLGWSLTGRRGNSPFGMDSEDPAVALNVPRGGIQGDGGRGLPAPTSPDSVASTATRSRRFLPHSDVRPWR